MTSYLLGDRSPRRLVIIFASAAHKYAVFEHKNILKDYEGENGSKIYLNEYLPSVLNETRKRHQDIIQQCKENVAGPIKDRKS